jgi:hypothetical protein
MNQDMNILKEFIDKEMLAELYREQKQKEQQELERLNNAVRIDFAGKSIEVNIKKKITPETRHSLRQIVKEYPRHKIKFAVEKMKGKYPDLSEWELRQRFLAENPEIHEDDFINYLQGTYIDEEYEQNLDIFFLKYFQAIISTEGNSIELTDCPVATGGVLNPGWRDIDMEEVKQIVSIFRKKVGI